MPVIRKPNDKPLSRDGGMMVPARFVPSFRVVYAEERGKRENILFRMHGGLGDVICAEPAVRYAMKHFKGLTFSLATVYPGLFQHLKFDNIYTEANVADLNLDSYLMYENTDTSNELAAEFVCHTLMHGIDYASLYMWRMLLPRAERQIMLVPTQEEIRKASEFLDPVRDVVLHPGKTWASRTMPKGWWDKVIKAVQARGFRPVLIGGQVDLGFGPNGTARASTVDVDTNGCLDLRSQLSVMETVALLQQANVLVSNDSSPVHMATTGSAWIGFLSTVKHPDHLYTYRNGTWAWRMQDLARGGLYEDLDACPNKKSAIKVDQIDIQDLLRWLPDPGAVARWACDRAEYPGQARTDPRQVW